jgi:hypothetical protein
MPAIHTKPDNFARVSGRVFAATLRPDWNAVRIPGPTSICSEKYPVVTIDSDFPISDFMPRLLLNELLQTHLPPPAFTVSGKLSKSLFFETAQQPAAPDEFV